MEIATIISIETFSAQFGPMDLAFSPTVSLNLIEVPQHFDLLAVLDYDVWVNNEDDENGGEENLLELSPEYIPSYSQFPKISSGLYYIIGYINGEDDLHQLIHIPGHINNISFRITQNLGNYQLDVSPGIELLEEPE